MKFYTPVIRMRTRIDFFSELMLCPSVTGTHSKAYSIKKSIFILIFAFGTERIKK